MISKDAENYLSNPGIKKSIEDLIEEGHDNKVRDLVEYNNVINLSNISYEDGFKNGINFERNKEDYDTYIISLFKSIEIDGLPKRLIEKTRSKICICFCPGDNCKEIDRYILSYYDWDCNKWTSCLGDIFGEIKPTKYLELPEPEKMKKEYNVTGQTRSTNNFKNLPDGIYNGKFGGHVGMVEYLGNIYNFTFPKGIPASMNIPKTITVINGYGWVFLSDGPIYPPFTIE